MSLSTVSLNPSCKAEVRFKFRCCNSYTDDALVQPNPNLQWIGTPSPKWPNNVTCSYSPSVFRIAGADPVVSTVKRILPFLLRSNRTTCFFVSWLPTSLNDMAPSFDKPRLLVFWMQHSMFWFLNLVSKRGFTLTKCPLM